MPLQWVKGWKVDGNDGRMDDAIMSDYYYSNRNMSCVQHMVKVGRRWRNWRTLLKDRGCQSVLRINTTTTLKQKWKTNDCDWLHSNLRHDRNVFYISFKTDFCSCNDNLCWKLMQGMNDTSLHGHIDRFCYLGDTLNTEGLLTQCWLLEYGTGEKESVSVCLHRHF